MSKPFILFGFSFYLLASGALAQTLGGCSMFPANNVWNTPIDKLPVDANSAAYVATIGTSKYLHPDFSSSPSGGGIPYIVVAGTQPKVPVVFGAGLTESDPGPYPIPATAPVEQDGDGHVLVLENTNCVLYELYQGVLQPDGSWMANSGAIFPLKSNQLRPAGWTSTDAAGFAILPGLVRYDEVAAGVINHAIRMTAPQTRNQYIWPARHLASSLSGTQYPPMGQRFRLKASFDISPYPADVQVILTALKKYGALLADNGSSWFLTGAPDPRWNDTTLHTLQQVFGSNLEAVDESSLMSDPNSGAVATTGTTYTVRVNAGGSGVMDSLGQNWNSDEDYSGGSTWSVSNAISGTTAPALYQTCRYGSSFAYQVPVPNGSYTVNLKFAELYETAAGLRLFNVAVNGAAVLTNFDIFAQAGGEFKAVDKSFPVTVTNGQINIQFTTGNANLPMINAIEVIGSTTSAPPSSVMVNAGGGSVVDSLGHTWTADEDYSGGYPWSTAHAIAGTTSQALYQTCRYGSSFGYRFTVPNGNYTVTLKFAEPYETAAGLRQFNVAINSAAVLTNFDIFAKAGGENVAVDKAFPVTVTNGVINIQFSTGAANLPMVSAISIVGAQ